MRFHDYTLIAGGKFSRRVQDSSAIARAAVEVFRDMLERFGDSFHEPIPVVQGYSLMFSSEGEGAAFATFFSGQTPVTTSALLSGRDSQAEGRAVEEFQRLVVQLFRGTELEPAWDLAGIEERPVIVSLILPSAGSVSREAVGMIADMETCLAASYFEAVESDD